MTSPAILAKLNVKNVRFDIGSGGTPDITPEDVAGALSGLNDGPYRLGLVKYAGKEEERARLRMCVLELAITKAYAQSWGMPVIDYPRGRITGIVEFALWDNISPKHCPACAGTGKNRQAIESGQVSAGQLLCLVCKGESSYSVNDADEADIAKIPMEHWRNTWGSRARALSDAVKGWDELLQRRLNRQLHG